MPLLIIVGLVIPFGLLGLALFITLRKKR